jgi:hypothetical protein
LRNDFYVLWRTQTTPFLFQARFFKGTNAQAMTSFDISVRCPSAAALFGWQQETLVTRGLFATDEFASNYLFFGNILFSFN